MPQFTATATRALSKVNMPSNGPASQRAQSWTSETMLLVGFALSTTSTIPTTMIKTTTLTTRCTMRASKPAPLADPRAAVANPDAGPAGLALNMRGTSCWSSMPSEQRPAGREPPKGIRVGGGQSRRRVAATATVGCSDGWSAWSATVQEDDLLACADHCKLGAGLTRPSKET